MPLTRWTRIAAMALVGTLVLIGCGGGDDDEDEPTEAAQATATSAPAITPTMPASPTAAASPISSPAAATPVAATPIASPVASPVVSPVAAAGSDASATAVSVVLLDYRVNAFQTEFAVGQTVTISIENNGSETHQFAIERKGAVNQPLQNAGQTALVDGIEPGATATLMWTFTEAGEYQFACHRDGHYDKGMVRDTIVVRS